MTYLAKYIYQAANKEVNERRAHYLRSTLRHQVIKTCMCAQLKEVISSPIVLTGVVVAGVYVSGSNKFGTLRQLVRIRQMIKQLS
ncbi:MULTISPECIES: hypothetical protein [Pseudoalteromonas]|uniref:Uncharacterized protein n=1 Tax=Pseudoalteromonas amylolytica TaxID=1859457 RepID=A0A1S1MRC6_9GAMM|nr:MULTISPECIES: hypothetical protein [Pseudoalteromonas]OHU86785.1 hypothetical protein BFC16_14920 [Pseudoalteromonas sp. JW3]OHU88690.1 hypothetical protein BET10_17835 [Pseudoalteromonas amylolytica]